MMEPIISLSMGLVLGNVLYILKNKPKKFSETSLIYLRDAKEIFKEIVDNLSEIEMAYLNQNQSPNFNFVPNMKEMINIHTSTGPSFKKQQLDEAQEFFRSVVNLLEELYKRPQNAYQREDYEIMRQFFESAVALFRLNPMMTLQNENFHQTAMSFNP